MATIPDAYHDLFEKATIAHVTTMNPDGTPHATPVWIGYDADDDRLLVNTERHRRKARNAERDPTVAASMTDPDDDYRFLSVTGEVAEITTDPDDDYRFLSVTGEVAEITTDGAREHIDALAHRYTGDDYAVPIESERVLLRIRADEVITGQ
ncbi:nitroimidazol reductase NimA-like FMN-containing flavoprotein (pyridoxamine 5'-phosphate oxidase superfamily) [Halarchaeum solikamskense]|uniref:pyridoxamine 5'-phosphate oxidase family protein n=1 Tax=Halarchaeum nitratireducens TaxID=489913 RepID=UPI001B3AFB7C|nr:PPOX class F420-dependent oxidoreductase [Halarchaeum solikamskense]MBP2250686.1 nitroimidazol reductase NimA-like FMN-containing flavoprotein (pyridoxamine 5'-phosphate oxidase superfamily) [Halarchaeum solikamskense]